MRTNFLNTIGFILVLIFPVGCTSSFKGEWLDAEPTPAGDNKEIGIPVVMSRPIFFMDISEADEITKEKNYQVSVEWLPDNEARYSLTLDPAMWTTSGFSTSFDDNGFLSDGSGSLTSQVVANINTLGSLAASLVRSGILDEQSALGEIESVLFNKKVMSSKECLVEPLWPYSLSVETPNDNYVNFVPLKTVLESIKNRWFSYIPNGTKPEDKYTTLLERIHYGNEQEKACFKVLQEQVNETSLATVKKSRNDFEVAALSFQKNFESKESLARLSNIVNAVNATNIELLKSKFSNDYNKEFGENKIDRDELDKLSNLLELGHNYASSTSSGQSFQVLEQIIRMDADTWRARQSQELQDRIKRVAIEADRLSNESKRELRNQYVRKLAVELHQLTDTIVLANQIKNIENLLLKELPLLESQEGERYPLEEYVQAHEQLEKLQTEMIDRLNTSNKLGTLSLIPLNNQFDPVSIDTGQVPACVKELMKKSVDVLDNAKGIILTRGTPDFIDQFNNGEVAQKQCTGIDELPEYVFILRPVKNKKLVKVKQASNVLNDAVGDKQ